MQGGNGYGGGYGYGGYGYGYDAGGYGYDAGAYGSAGGYGYSSGYDDPASAAPPAYVDAPLVMPERSAHGLPAPPAMDAVELQPSDACPKNYVIFDQTRTGSSSVTYHPSLAHKLGGGSPSSPAGSFDDDGCSPAREEDSEEIDALLQSSEEDDVTSTCSSSAAAGGRTRKKDRIKKMVRALKGVVPGGSKMDTPAVLDEAVWYLKSLKLEAATNKKKHGARGGSDS